MLNSNLQDLYQRTAVGAQDYLTIDTVPNGSAIIPGTRLLGTALPDGTYGCFVPLGGFLNKLTLLLKATFGAGSVTTSGGSVMLDKATTITAALGVGAMATTVRQTVTLAPINGEKNLLLTIVVAGGGGTPAFTEAEFFGH
jgi:hypothetical protein